MLHGGARNFIQCQHHPFERMGADHVQNPCMWVYVCGKESPKGTSEKWAGGVGRDPKSG